MVKKTLATLAIASLSLMATEKITGAGASFPATVYYDWAHKYKADTGVQVNYQSIGSGGGIKQIKARTVNFGASDKPLNAKKLASFEKKGKGLYQFPAVIGSIVLAYNLPNVADGQLKLSNENIADIFLGKIKYWNDKRIAANNSGVKLPEKKITVIRRSDGSGTTYNYTYFLSQVSDLWKSEIGYGKSVDWPVGIGGKGNEGVTNLLKQTPYSIGYIEYSYKQRMNLKAATLQSKEGTWVEAKQENFQAAAAYAKWTKDEHFYQMLTLQPGKNSYPIVAATFILLPKGDKFKEMNKKVTTFYEHSFKTGDARAAELGYIPLPEATKNMIRSYWKDHGVK